MSRVLHKRSCAQVLFPTAQVGKEGILGRIMAIATNRLWRAYRVHRLPPLTSMDWLAIAFSVIVVAYLVIPNELLGGHAGLGQRLAAVRLAALIPLLYAPGRTDRTANEGDPASVARISLGP